MAGSGDIDIQDIQENEDDAFQAGYEVAVKSIANPYRPNHGCP